jgi:hypothetical protein
MIYVSTDKRFSLAAAAAFWGHFTLQTDGQLLSQRTHQQL